MIVSSAGTASARADAPAIAPASAALTVNLGAVARQTFVFSADQAAALELSVEAPTLAADIARGEIAFALSSTSLALVSGQLAAVEVSVKTSTMARSLLTESARLVARDVAGAVVAESALQLSVEPTYIVHVLDGPPKDSVFGSFEFDSTPGLSKFRPHAAGLRVLFVNLSTQYMTLHGDYAIPHADDILPPARIVDGKPVAHPKGTYEIPAILPSAGANLKGMYTIHAVYEPSREVLFNVVAE